MGEKKREKQTKRDKKGQKESVAVIHESLDH
jgi:hypothetical protein